MSAAREQRATLRDASRALTGNAYDVRTIASVLGQISAILAAAKESRARSAELIEAAHFIADEFEENAHAIAERMQADALRIAEVTA